jgi:hypothetical protein
MSRTIKAAVVQTEPVLLDTRKTMVKLAERARLDRLFSFVLSPPPSARTSRHFPGRGSSGGGELFDLPNSYVHAQKNTHDERPALVKLIFRLRRNNARRAELASRVELSGNWIVSRRRGRAIQIPLNYLFQDFKMEANSTLQIPQGVCSRGMLKG